MYVGDRTDRDRKLYANTYNLLSCLSDRPRTYPSKSCFGTSTLPYFYATVPASKHHSRDAAGYCNPLPSQTEVSGMQRLGKGL